MSVMTLEGQVYTRSSRTGRPQRAVPTRRASRPSRPSQSIRSSRTSQASRPVHLTARGRAVAFVASLLALGALVVGAGQMVEATAGGAVGGAAGEPVAVVVGSGDTLWGIAQEIAPDRDPRSVVQQIRSLNDLGTRSIVPGQSILVPIAG